MLAKLSAATCAASHAVILQGWSESVVVKPYQLAAERTEFSVTVKLQGWSESVVVEPYQAAAECTEFSVTVIGTSKGPVALLPTEAEVFDYADDIFEADLDFEAYRARREVCLPVCLSVCLSVPPSVRLSVCLSVLTCYTVKAWDCLHL